MNRKKDDYRRAEGYARKLIEAGDRPEDQIRQDLCGLLNELGIESLLSHQTDRGPADLYLPQRRTFIETKRRGLAQNFSNPQSGRDETPLQQLERYLQAEIDRELGMPELYRSDEERRRAWTGILTDGDVWSVWKYPHKTHATAERDKVCENHRFSSAGELVDKLQELLPENQLIGKPWISARPKQLFVKFRTELHALYGSLDYSEKPGTKTKFELWLDMLRVSGMAPETAAAQRKMFVDHSFLVCLARGVIHTVSHPHEDPDAESILADGFVAWIVEATKEKQWAQKLLDRVHNYEWRLRRGDVLRSIYQEFIDKSDRKLFGEYYTPDWLAKMLVDIVCDDAWCEHAVGAVMAARNNKINGIGVLDPSCGSGTFLYYAAKKLLNSKGLQHLGAGRQAEMVARLVHGLDVHPVAVEIARATLLRALPAPPPDELDALRIYQGDALLAREDEGLFSYDRQKDELQIKTPKGTTLALPEAFLRGADFITDMRRLADSAWEGKDALPDSLLHEEFPAKARGTLERAHQALRKIVEEEGDSVWAWYVINMAGPFLLARDKVDRIVANPPWVRMSEIQVTERKETLQNLAGKPMKPGKSVSSLSLGLWGGGKNATSFDIAQLFVRRCRDLYLHDRKQNPAAWLVNAAAISTSSWKRFRDWHEQHLSQIIDFRQLRKPPFSGAKSCALLQHCRYAGEESKHLLAINQKDKIKITSQMAPELLKDRIAFEAAPEPIPTASSGYLDRFRQGATFVPHVLLRVENCQIQGNRAKLSTYRSTKAPWKKLDTFDGTLPARWIRPTLSSKDIFAFHVRQHLGRMIVPLANRGIVLDAAPLREPFWAELNQVYSEYCGKGSGTPNTLIEQIDFKSKLSVQLSPPLEDGKLTVVQPLSGQTMRAARIDRRSALIEHTLYWWDAPNEPEALYLLAMLNAPALRKAFADARPSDRHFSLSPWTEVPIPLFDSCNEDHIQLSKLAEKAELACLEWADKNREKINKSGQISISKSSRELPEVTAALDEIDEVIRKLMPEQATD